MSKARKEANRLGAKLDREEDEREPKTSKKTVLVIAKGRAICGANVSRVLSGAEKDQPEEMGDQVIPEYLHKKTAAAERALKAHMKAGNIVKVEIEVPIPDGPEDEDE